MPLSSDYQPEENRYQSFRKEYDLHAGGLSRIEPNPFFQFTQWLEEAMVYPVAEPNAMCLATVGSDGMPASRMVLLKGFDHRGFVFYSNRESRKGLHLQENPKACLLFFWEPLQRQVRIEGTVSLESEEDSSRYFSQRPRESQIGAWASKQSRPLPSREELEEGFAALTNRFGTDEIPKPEVWGGFVLKPGYFEFWQGRPNRLHDRFAYRLQNDHWEITRLYP